MMLFIFIIFIFNGIDYASCQCDSDWTEYEDNCYIIKTLNDDQNTWHDAEGCCMASGGHLTSINNQAEMDFLNQMAFDKVHVGNVWIGGNQLKDRNGPYSWSDESTANYTHYAEGQPRKDGLHQCLYAELLASDVSECFDYRDGRSGIKGVINTPDDASPPDTFFFGEWTEDEEGVDLCKEECKKIPQCHSYTFMSTLSTDSTWAGHCTGASAAYTVDEQDFYAYTGKRVPCHSHRGEGVYNSSGLWYSGNCGTNSGFICKKSVSSPGPVTTAPPPYEESCCPQGYFNIANGTKCFRVLTTTDDNDENGMTWDEALSFCRSGPGINPDIAAIENDLENAEVLSAMKGDRYVNGVWLGLYVDVLSNDWVWADNSNPSYLNWDSNKPESENNKTCAEMYISPGHPGTWSNNNCAVKSGYVCQTYKDSNNPVNTPNPPPFSCESGWTAYWYACYKLVTERKNWESAEEQCQAEHTDGHLVSIHTEIENSAVYAFAAGNLPVWLGLKKGTDDVFRWTDYWITRYINWANDSSEGGSGCVEMLSTGEWKNVDCEKTSLFLCKYAIVDHLTTPTHVEGLCPNNWIHSGEYCYSFVADGDLNWQDAQNECNDLAGDRFDAKLASIHNIQENHFIIDHLKKKGATSSSWIGLTRKDNVSDFEWIDDTAFDYQQWAPSQPDGQNRYSQCTQMSTTQFAGAWFDESCDTLLESYTCMAKKATIATPVSPTEPDLPPTGSQTCPSSEWLKYGDDCLLFIADERLIWTLAADKCAKVSDGRATLTSVNDDTENWFMMDRMAVINGSDFWIGLYRDRGGDNVCFTRNDGKNTVKGIIDHPSEANPPNTFHFGRYSGDNDDAGLIWCQEECGKIADCASYSFSSVLNPDSNWKGECVGRALMEFETADLYFYSGDRIPCQYTVGPYTAEDYQWLDGSEVSYTNWSPDSQQTSDCVHMTTNGLWDDISCGTELSFVCRWKDEPMYTTISSTTEYPTSCIDGDWVELGDKCYLFSSSKTSDKSWGEAQDYCAALSEKSSGGFDVNLVSIQSVNENDALSLELQQRYIEDAWIGLYKNEDTFTWVDNSTVNYTNWAPNQPDSELASCTEMSRYGRWSDTTGCNVIEKPFICKQSVVVDSRVQPQYQIIIKGDFYSSTGEDFSTECIIQYAEAMNEKTAQMALHVNSLIGSQLCSTLTANDMKVASASSLFFINGAQGEASPTFYFALGRDLLISNVETCAAEVTAYVLPHSVWGEPILPQLPGCPDVIFTQDEFYHHNDNWLCAAATGNNIEFSSVLNYGIVQSGNFQTENGELLNAECLQQYNSDFATKTYEMIQSTNSALESGALCSGYEVIILTGSSYLVAGEKEGLSSQNYVLQPSSDLHFSQVYTCADEVSSHLSNHQNWVLPILPQNPGCPRLLFSPEVFYLSSQQWICV